MYNNHGTIVLPYLFERGAIYYYIFSMHLIRQSNKLDPYKLLLDTWYLASGNGVLLKGSIPNLYEHDERCALDFHVISSFMSYLCDNLYVTNVHATFDVQTCNKCHKMTLLGGH